MYLFIHLFYISSSVSHLSFSPSTISILPPLSHCIHSYISILKFAGLPRVSTKQDIASCSKTKHFALY